MDSAKSTKSVQSKRRDKKRTKLTPRQKRTRRTPRQKSEQGERNARIHFCTSEPQSRGPWRKRPAFCHG